ncbi:hypothetical protein BGZ50_000899 [Haplosporangium sp. Z 11]|nr:hypothetical protein BGZ50_000899 [Haplosporangium sp. Z 11]
MTVSTASQDDTRRSDSFDGHLAHYTDKQQCPREDSGWTNNGHSHEAAQTRLSLDEHEARYRHHGQRDSAQMHQERDDDKGSSVGSNDQADNNDDFQDEAMSDEDNMEEDELDESEESLVAQDSNSLSSTNSKEKPNSLVINMYTSRKHVKVRSMFVDKLFKMVEDSSIQHLISWAKEGDMFYVYNCIKLSDTVLPKFFKHNNWQSFVRQLNMYGFHKIYRYDRGECSGHIRLDRALFQNNESNF